MAGERKLLTDLTVKSLKPSRDTQRDVWDTSRTSPPGFGVRVSPHGTRAWQIVLRVYHPASKQWLPVRKTIERVDRMKLADARQEAHRLAAEAKAGTDIRKSAQRRAVQSVRDAEHAAAFSVVRELFLAHCEKTMRPATVRNYRLGLSYCDAWGDRPLAHITKLDSQAVFDGLLRREKRVMANRVHDVLRNFFKWAADNDRFTGDVPLKKDRPGGAETAADRSLSDVEIGIVYRACDALDAVQKPLTLCLMMLGQRSGETTGMRWKELQLDGDAPTWTIPAERAKNKKVHVLPLPSAVVNILQGVPRVTGGAFVFWSDQDKKKPLRADRSDAIKTVRRQCVKIAAAEGVSDQYNDAWSAHDLRRTIVSGMARLGIDQHLADRIISHSDSSLSTVAKIYQQHDFQHEARAALERWCRHVMDLGEGRKAEKVVPIKRA